MMDAQLSRRLTWVLQATKATDMDEYNSEKSRLVHICEEMETFSQLPDDVKIFFYEKEEMYGTGVFTEMGPPQLAFEAEFTEEDYAEDEEEED